MATVRRLMLLLVFCTSLVCRAQDSSASGNGEDTSGVDIEDTYDSVGVNESPQLRSIVEDTLTAGQEKSATVRIVPVAETEKMKKQREFNYANDSTFWKEKAPVQPAFLKWLSRILSSNVTEVIFYMVLAAIVIFVLYQIIVVNKFTLFSRSTRTKSPKQIQTILDPVEQWKEDLEGALATKNYRLAIRLLYLLTLHQLDTRKEIRLQAIATNHDYLNQMRNSPRYKDFVSLTNIYEYVWYGEFEPDSDQFQTMQDHFIKFDSRF